MEAGTAAISALYIPRWRQGERSRASPAPSPASLRSPQRARLLFCYASTATGLLHGQKRRSSPAEQAPAATTAKRRRADAIITMVRLLTLNALRCNRRDVNDGSLALRTTKVEVRTSAAAPLTFLREFLGGRRAEAAWRALVEF